MNDAILSSLLNLFALYNTKSGIDRGAAREVLSNYLSHHFGIRNVDEQLNFYDELVSHYDSAKDINRDSLARETSIKVREKLLEEDRILAVLRFMEVQHVGRHVDDCKDEFKCIADNFAIDDVTFEDLFCFVADDRESPGVKSLQFGGGTIRTLYLKKYDTLVFSYNGSGEIRYNDVQVLPGSFIVWQRSGVLKCQGSKPLYYYNAMTPHNESERKGKVPLKLRGDNINFRFPKGVGGIHNFTFNLYGGELVAIMGGSGTGKTTLLSLLNGSLHPQEGKITINGHSIDEPQAKALIGFVPQDDLLIEELTVYENLLFTARLCFDGMSEEELDRKVMALLHDLGLEAAKDLKAGSPINKFISGGQRKRLNIALELIREPDVLFLDEPTSGLSSADTNAVVNLLREQAYKGRLIIANIHQPSSDVFKLFDRLWVLDTGGYPVYDGNPIEAVTYFKRQAGYADSDVSTCPTCGNVNSEIILDILDEKVISDEGRITDKRKISPQEWHENYLKTVPAAKDKVEELPRTEQHRPSALKQMLIYLQRNLKAKFTDRQWLLITLLEAPLLAVICAVLTHYAPLEGYSIMDNQNLVSYFFMAVIVATFLGMSGSAEEIIKDRALLKREKFLNLSCRSYIWSKILFMAGVAAIQTLLFILTGNGIMGIHCLFWKWWLILFSTSMLASLMGLLLSQCLSSIVAIYITIPLLLIPQILLCGLVVKFPDLAPRSTTGNVPAIGEVIPSRWSFEALSVTSFTDNDYECNFFEYDKEKYQARYYESAYLHELKSQLETMKDKADKGEATDSYLEVIRTSTPLLLDVCGWEPYDGDYSYDSLKKLYKDAGDFLYARSRKANNASDERMSRMIESLGKEGVVGLKKDNYNLKLESQLVNADAEQIYKIVDGHIVPSAGFVFLDPVTCDGRAPFFSSVKILGSWRIKTLWYNLGVLLLMSIICAVCLLEDFPGKKLRT